MNLLLFILFFLGVVALICKLLDIHPKLASCFDQGMASFGSLLVSLCGWYVVMIPLINNQQQTLLQLFKNLPINFNIFIGCFLAPDLGGYHIIEAYDSNINMIIFAGICLTSILGCFFSFQLPIFLNQIKEDLPTLMYGFTIGIITLPITLIPLAMLLNISLLHLIPIFILCGTLLLGIIYFQHITLKLIVIFAKTIQYITYLLFTMVMIGLFIYPNLIDVTLLQEACIIVLKMSIIICGSLVLSQLLIKYFHKPLNQLATYLHIDMNSMLGLLLSLGSSIAMLPLYSKMNKTGKKMNAAFSISGAYVLGGQFAFIANICPQSSIYFILTKLVAGIISIITVYLLTKKENQS